MIATSLPRIGPAPTLEQLRSEEALCRRCPLYRDATQVVPGEGQRGAALMLVGEQPGDREDLAGKPFVGPAGRLLDAALAEAGIARSRVFVTNAVKHFKYEWRGKRRLHKRPDAGEIEQCRWWLDLERRIIQPAVILAMGATAAHSLLGRRVVLSKTRGRILSVVDGASLMVTVHPSSLLRIEDRSEKRSQYQRFREDLRAAVAAAARQCPIGIEPERL
jgi:DNA polymerase